MCGKRWSNRIRLTNIVGAVTFMTPPVVGERTLGPPSRCCRTRVTPPHEVATVTRFTGEELGCDCEGFRSPSDGLAPAVSTGQATGTVKLIMQIRMGDLRRGGSARRPSIRHRVKIGCGGGEWNFLRAEYVVLFDEPDDTVNPTPGDARGRRPDDVAWHRRTHMYGARKVWSGALVSAAVLATLAPAVHAQSKVEVVNTPDVRVVAPVPHAVLERFTDIRVSPSPDYRLRYREIGVLNTGGFTRAMLSLGADLPGSREGGRLGVIMIPDQPWALEAMLMGRPVFPLEAEVRVARDVSGPVAAMPFEHPISFPKYRVFVYNSSDKPLVGQLFVYLTN